MTHEPVHNPVITFLMSVPLKPVLQTQPGMEVVEGSFDAVVEAVLEEVVCELVVFH